MGKTIQFPSSCNDNSSILGETKKRQNSSNPKRNYPHKPKTYSGKPYCLSNLAFDRIGDCSCNYIHCHFEVDTIDKGKYSNCICKITLTYFSGIIVKILSINIFHFSLLTIYFYSYNYSSAKNDTQNNW